MRGAQPAPPAADHQGVSQTGPVVPGLRLLEPLGRGAQSVVHRARRGDGTDVAVKILLDPAGRARLHTEAVWMVRCRRAGLPEVYDVGETDGQPYLVMEFVAGDRLGALLGSGPLAATDAARIGADIADALAVVHRADLVHRDVKPDNVIVGPDGRARLVDLGLATRPGGLGDDTVAGTLTYAAPEQSGTLQRPVDARSDLYALGVVLYECLTGHPPFRTSDPGEMLRLHAVADPPGLGPQVPATLAAVVRRLLAKDPDDRYAGAPGLASDLRALAADPAAGFTPGQDDRPVARDEPPLTGRDAELAALTQLGERIGAGGRCALVLGAAGSGRSRLLREFGHRMENSGVPVLHGMCRPGDPPLAVLSRAVDAYLEQDPSGEILERFREAAGSAVHYLGRLSPVLRQRLGTPPVTAGDAGAYLRAVAAFLAGLAERAGGLVLTVDDAHRLDDATGQVLRQLTAQRATTGPLIVAAATDPVPAGITDWAGEDAVTVRLGPLDGSALAQLAAAYIGGYPLAEGLRERIGSRGDGSPLTTLLLARAAVDAGLVTPRNGRLDVDAEALKFLDIPSDLEGLLLGRLDALGAAGRELLTAAAVAGLRFDLATAAAVAGAEPGEARAACDLAVGQGLLECDDDGYAFVHERLAASLLAEVPADRLRDLHQRAADAIGGHDTATQYAEARHLLLGHPGRDPARTVAACLAAASAALDEHAGSEAVGFLEAAQPYLAGTAPDLRIAVTEATGRACQQVGRLAEADDRYAEALHAADDPLVRARLHERLANLRLGRWQIDAALHEAEQGLTVLGRPVDTGRLTGVVTAVAYLIAAIFVERTRIGFGTADPRRLARFRQLFALNATASYASLLATRLGRMSAHEYRARYSAARIGHSVEYARQLVHNAALRQSFTRRPAPRAFARAHAAAVQVGDPGAVLYADYLHRLTETQTGEPDLEEYQRWLQRHSALLTTADGLNLALSLASWWHLRGRLPRMRAAIEQGVGQLWHADLASGSLPRAKALAGRRQRPPGMDEAAAILDAADPTAGDPASRLMTITVVLDACYQQHEYGATFDRAAAELAGLGLRPTYLAATLRGVFVTVTYGRLEQLRAASPGARPAALAEARRALRVLREASRGGRGPCRLLAAHHGAARAHLAWLEAVDDRGRRRALRLLTEADELGRAADVPSMVASGMLLRARDAALAGRSEEAAAHARAATGLAERIGMTQWAHAVRREFGLAAGEAALGPVTGDGGTADRRRLAALERLSRTVSGMVHLDALSRAVLDETVVILNAERAYLFLGDGTGRLQPHSGRDAHGNSLGVLTDYGSTIVDRVWSTGEPVVVTGTDEGAALGSQSVVLHGLRSIMAAPLVMDGRVLGVVYLDSRVAKGIFTPADVGILSAITQHVAAAVETARAAQLAVAVRAAEQQRDMADTLRESMIRFSRSLDAEQILDALRDTLARVLPADGSWLVLASEDGDLTLLDAATRSAVHRTPRLNALLAAPGPVPVTDPGLGSARLSAGGFLAVPLHRQEIPVGLILLAATAPDVYGPTEVKLAAALAEEAMVAYDNAVLFARVRYLATTDALTGVSNRRHFFDLAEAMHRSARVAGDRFVAVMADIDHFKGINDRYGHQAGDQVIASVAARLRDALPDGGELGRYGGEEFAAVWVTPDDPAVAAERLRRAVTASPVETVAGPVRVTVSVGVCPAGPGQDDLAAVLRAADEALYRAKEAGRDRVASSADLAPATGPSR